MASKAEAQLSLDTSDFEAGAKRAQELSNQLIANDKRVTDSALKNDTAQQRIHDARAQRMERSIRDDAKRLAAINRSLDKEIEQNKRAAQTQAQETMRAIDRTERYRLDSMKRVMQARQRMEGGAGANVAGRGGGHAGGHSGGGEGGFMSGAAAQSIGDVLDNVTGHSGWVRRLRGVNMFGSGITGSLARLGIGAGVGVAGAGAVTAAAYKLISEAKQASGDMGASHAEFDKVMPGINERVRGSFSADSLAGERAGLLDERRKLEEQQSRLRGDHFGVGSPYQMPGQRLGAAWRHPFASGSGLGEEERTNRLEQGQAGALERLRASKYGEAVNIERDSTAAQTRGDILGASQIDISLREKDAIEKNRQANGGADALKSIQDRFAMERVEAQRSASLRQSALDRSGEEIYLRRTGKNMEVRGAEAKLNIAKSDQGLLTENDSSERKQAAQQAVDAAQQELNETKLLVGSRRRIRDIEKESADFRGNADERALHVADEEIKKARISLEAAKTDEEWKDRDLALTKAIRAEEQTRLSIAERRIAAEASVKRGGVAVGLALQRAGRNLYTPDEGVRFAAGQDEERARAAGGVRDAVLDAKSAAAVVAAQKADPAHGGKADQAAIDAQTEAQQRLAIAVSAQLETEKKLNFEAKERTRQLQLQQRAMEVQTEAMRLSNSGRSDKAGLLTSRAGSEAQAAELERAGHPELAAHIRTQQALRETGQADDLWLNPNGTKKSTTSIHAQWRMQERVSKKRDKFNKKLEANDGLVDVHRGISGEVQYGRDAITGEYRGPTPPESYNQPKGTKDEDAGKSDTQLLKDIKQAMVRAWGS